MTRTYKITYITPQGRMREVVLEATSRYDAKLRFYRCDKRHLECDIERIEVVKE